jgi:transcriptional regulator with XRE-family HTH domain
MDKEVEKVLDSVRRIRIEKELSLLEVATRAEISHSYLYYLEAKRKVPTLTILNRLAKALGVKMRDFF